MTEHDKNLRDFAAMFAMMGLLVKGDHPASVPTNAFKLADEFMDAREYTDSSQGIIAIKKSRKAKDV